MGNLIEFKRGNCTTKATGFCNRMVSSPNIKSTGSLKLLFLLFWTTSSAQVLPTESCIKKNTPAIPSWHIYHKLCKPIIIGHRGNPLHFQENTMEGFKSVRRFGVSAFELDVYLTKDGKLVLFHDKNTLRTTGVNRAIQEMTSSEIKKIRYLKNIKYGKNTVTYNRKRRIAFLDQVLRWAKGKKILIMLEIKPSDVILNAAKEQNTVKTSTAVAKMVKKFRMHRQVLVVSFNYYATLSAKRANPHLAIGTFYVEMGWRLPSALYRLINLQLSRLLPGLKDCLKTLPSSNRTLGYFLTTGSLEKSIQASFAFIMPNIFNNPEYGGPMNNNTMQMVRGNYGRKFVVGTGGFYDIHLPKEKIRSSLETHKRVIKLGVKMIFTDDLIKTKRLVRKTIKAKCHFRHHRHRNHYNRDQHNTELVDQDTEIEAAQRARAKP